MIWAHNSTLRSRSFFLILTSPKQKDLAKEKRSSTQVGAQIFASLNNVDEKNTLSELSERVFFL
ncbi:hypothetical protein HY04_11380 [Kaistella antarctica]|uniref:Uncharacterized protein n=1 Tax=Kaistella antarctica TaxID=266748 RepID=A0ABR4TYK8_9FLAO|nr:hypothetical protein HY04_11380 [Kaistella antarctica]